MVIAVVQTVISICFAEASQIRITCLIQQPNQLIHVSYGLNHSSSLVHKHNKSIYPLVTSSISVHAGHFQRFSEIDGLLVNTEKCRRLSLVISIWSGFHHRQQT